MANTLVIRENPTSSQDVTVTGVAIDSEIILATALLAAGSPLEQTKVIEVQMEYEAEESHALVFEYSVDKGATWAAYSTLTVGATLGPTILTVRKTITHHNIQFRVRSLKLGKLRVISLVPRVVLESMVHP